MDFHEEQDQYPPSDLVQALTNLQPILIATRLLESARDNEIVELHRRCTAPAIIVLCERYMALEKAELDRKDIATKEECPCYPSNDYVPDPDCPDCHGTGERDKP